MFGSIVLEVLIGLALIYLLLSLVCSTVQEAIASWLNWRGLVLRQAIARLMGEQAKDADTARLTSMVYAHPLVDALRRGDRDPSYIPNRTFANVLVSLLSEGGGGARMMSADDRLVGVLRAIDGSHGGATTLPAPLQQSLRSLMESARAKLAGRAADSAQTLEAFKREVCDWFEHTMNRATGWYRRRTQVWQFVIAFVVVFFTNADTLMISEQLANDPAARAALVASAEEAVKEPPPPAAAMKDAPVTVEAARAQYEDARKRAEEAAGRFHKSMEAARIQVGWPDPRWNDPDSREASLAPRMRILRKALGLIVTICAVALGAPFWFQMLEKLVKLRGSGSRLVAGQPETPGAKSTASAPKSSEAPTDDAAPATPPSDDSPAPAAVVAGVATAEETLDETYWSEAAGRWNERKLTALLAGRGDDSRRRVCLVAARLAALAYAQPWVVRARLAAIGVDAKAADLAFFDRAGTQAFAMRVGDTLFVAYRGTEPNEIQDLTTDARFALELIPPYAGRVHAGFAAALEHVWSDVAAWRAKHADAKRLVLTGHSLGAALATLHLARAKADANESAACELVTFGSPRVGDAKFCDSLDPDRETLRKPLDAPIVRFVHNRDLVTRVAPRSLDYDHLGAEVYVDAEGRVHDAENGRRKWFDFTLLVVDAASEFKRAAKQPIRDHAIALYVRRLESWTEWKA